MRMDKVGGFIEDGSAVIGTVTGFTPDAMPDIHAHQRGQLAWCPDRPVTVQAGRRLHLVSPSAAIWLPPECPHRISAEGNRQSINLYVRPGCAPLPDRVIPFALAGLEREMIQTLASASRTDRREPAFDRLTTVLWDRLNRPAQTLALALPGDHRLRRIALAHLEGAERTLDHWAETLALSRRSLQRLVVRDAGQNWTVWMRELRLARAIAPLMAGASVQAAAHKAGYATASGFVAAFHACYGITPGQLQRRMKA